MAKRELRVLWLYPEHMNIYADRGNIAVLERRCAWRGIGFELARAGPRDDVDPARTTSSTWAAARTATRRSSRATWSRRSASALAAASARRRGARRLRWLPAARPLIRAARRRRCLPALGLVDLDTVREPGPRLIGNVVIEARSSATGRAGSPGFENHGGRTYLGARRAAARPGRLRASATTARTAPRACGAAG